MSLQAWRGYLKHKRRAWIHSLVCYKIFTKKQERRRVPALFPNRTRLCNLRLDSRLKFLYRTMKELHCMASKSFHHHPGPKFYDSMNSQQTSVSKGAEGLHRGYQKLKENRPFSFLPQVFLRPLRASFRAPVGPNLTRVWDQSLSMGQKNPSWLVTAWLSLTV